MASENMRIGLGFPESGHEPQLYGTLPGQYSDHEVVTNNELDIELNRVQAEIFRLYREILFAGNRKMFESDFDTLMNSLMGMIEFSAKGDQSRKYTLVMGVLDNLKLNLHMQNGRGYFDDLKQVLRVRNNDTATLVRNHFAKMISAL